VTGILTDTGAVAVLLHARGALSFWDYAAAGPYVPIRVAEISGAEADQITAGLAARCWPPEVARLPWVACAYPQ
jgi:hypothetical protein